MKARILSFILCIFAATALFMPVSADFGPKPSVQIRFENMGDELCYGTLLSYYQSTGPASVFEGDIDSEQYSSEEYDVFRAFVKYEDSDGFYFLKELWEVSENKYLNWSYYPPDTFKILLYYPESGEFAVSGIYEAYAFDSYFTVDMAGSDGIVAEQSAPTLVAEKSYDYTGEIVMFIGRMLLTILVETAIALMFLITEKKLLRLIVITNAATQLILNILLFFINYTSGELSMLILYFLLEGLVFVIEMTVYLIFFNRLGAKRRKAFIPVLYAFVANLVSFAGGIVLSLFVPAMF